MGNHRGVSASRFPPAVRAPRGCSAIARAVCGSELRAGALCMYTREGRMCFRSLTVSPATTLTRIFEDREGNIWVSYRERPRPLSRLCRRHVFREPGSVERARHVRSGGQGWKHLARHFRWLEPMESRASYGLPRAQRQRPRLACARSPAPDCQSAGCSLSFRTVAGEFGLRRCAESATWRMTGSLPSAAFPA